MSLKKPSYIQFAPSWFFYVLIWLFFQLPYGFLLFVGKGLGKLVMILIPSRKKVVLTNLKICFPQQSELERINLCNSHFKELGMMVTQTLKAFLGNTDSMAKNVVINGGEHLQKCLDEKQGVLLVAGHFTGLDLGAKLLCKYFPIAGMYRPHKHPLVEYIVTKSRLKYATKMFKRDELRTIIKHLKNGGIMWYAPDQNYRRGQSVFVPFFGKLASTITATNQMARLSKCKVIYFHAKRNKTKPYYTLTLSPPVENFPSKNQATDANLMNQGIEEMIKRNPEEYLWVHKRFKTRPEGEESIY